ncbi:MAG: biotin/lipoate--protein ligase family protein [Hyphomicrobiaceae bacterium]
MIEPDLPPLLNGRQLVGDQPAMDAAISGATTGELGAGDVVWRDDPLSLELAIILEPDVDLTRAAQMLLLATVAAGDCIGVLAPPQVGVHFGWPGKLLVNGADAGSVALASATTDQNGIPDWLIVSVVLRLQFSDDGLEPGHNLGQTALSEEGCEELTHIQWLESYARHFLTWLHTWQVEGFRPVHQGWTERAAGRDEQIEIEEIGPATVTGLDECGNLLVKFATGDVRALALLDAVVTPTAIR